MTVRSWEVAKLTPRRTPGDIRKDLSALRIQDANEATTRQKFIDEILYEVLGWTKDDTQFEERVSEDGTTRYLDYLVHTAQTSFLIEAKRLSITFDNLPTTRRAVLKGSWMNGNGGAATGKQGTIGGRKGLRSGWPPMATPGSFFQSTGRTWSRSEVELHHLPRRQLSPGKRLRRILLPPFTRGCD